MAGPDEKIVPANETELADLTNQRFAERIILAVIGAAFMIAAFIMLVRFWQQEARRQMLLFVLGLLGVVYALVVLRSARKFRAAKDGEEFVLISGTITGKHIEGHGENAEYFIAINGRTFNVGPEVFAEVKIGARIGVREWKHNREFYDYTLSDKRLDEMLQRVKN